MKIQPQHAFALALVGAQGAWAADGATASLDFFNSSLDPLSEPGPFVFEYMAKGPEGEILTLKNERVSDPLKPTEPPKEITRVLTKEEVASELSGSIIEGRDGGTSFVAAPEGNPLCFVAGTLVHTKTGLVPIEKIQVGDYVLSKSDSGEGADEYKRVTKTFVRDDAPVWLITYVIADDDFAEQDKRMRNLVVTAEHPFWVERQGWTQTTKLEGGDALRCLGGPSKREGIVVWVHPVLATSTEDVGWAGGLRDTCGIEHSDGPMVDLRNGEITVSQPSDYYFDSVACGTENHLWQRVYNLEVEDSHTYYVGEDGIWVHNACATPRPSVEGTIESLGVRLNSEAEIAAGLSPEGKAIVYSADG